MLSLRAQLEVGQLVVAATTTVADAASIREGREALRLFMTSLAPAERLAVEINLVEAAVLRLFMDIGSKEGALASIQNVGLMLTATIEALKQREDQ